MWIFALRTRKVSEQELSVPLIVFAIATDVTSWSQESGSTENGNVFTTHIVASSNWKKITTSLAL